MSTTRNSFLPNKTQRNSVKMRTSVNLRFSRRFLLISSIKQTRTKYRLEHESSFEQIHVKMLFNTSVPGWKAMGTRRLLQFGMTSCGRVIGLSSIIQASRRQLLIPAHQLNLGTSIEFALNRGDAKKELPPSIPAFERRRSPSIIYHPMPLHFPYGGAQLDHLRVAWARISLHEAFLLSPYLTAAARFIQPWSPTSTSWSSTTDKFSVYLFAIRPTPFRQKYSSAS